MRYLPDTSRSVAGFCLLRGFAAATCVGLLLLASCGGSGGSGSEGSGTGGDGAGGGGTGGGATSQGAWSWEGGTNGLNGPGIYGTKGVAAAGNVPGTRAAPSSWRTPDGDFWLFGGSNGETSATTGPLNDLWRYSTTTRQWTWVSGSSEPSAAGVYGSQGVAASTNVPGARNLAVSWTDGAGTLWLFGGIGYDATGNSGNLNDLWKFDPATNLWTWVNGSTSAGASAVYGSKGISAPSNVPSGRNSSASWADAMGNLWLFGGYGVSTGAGAPPDYLNDLWKYSPVSGQWTWVSGSNSYGVFAPVEYGTQGVATAANIPGCRSGAFSWTGVDGRLWLFGGNSFDSARNSGPVNDLWSFDPSSGLWTWEGGGNNTEAAGVYGTQGVAEAENVPGARQEGVSWIDSAGNLWLLGGAASLGGLSDLWMYAPPSHEWTWMGGSSEMNAEGMYGTQGVASNANSPGARYSLVGWTDLAGNMWLFGGRAMTSNSYDTYNDLWKYIPQ